MCHKLSGNQRSPETRSYLKKLSTDKIIQSSYWKYDLHLQIREQGISRNSIFYVIFDPIYWHLKEETRVLFQLKNNTLKKHVYTQYQITIILLVSNQTTKFCQTKPDTLRKCYPRRFAMYYFMTFTFFFKYLLILCFQYFIYPN